MRLRAGAASDVGRVRQINEDASAVDAERGLLVVCDGMGGAAAGEVASQTAVQTVVSLVSDNAVAPIAHGDPSYLPHTARLVAAVRAANTAIRQRASADATQSGMGTTIVAVLLADNVAAIAHVGDSRAYLWQRGQLERLTTDHSLVEEEVQAGVRAREGSLQAETQNVLLRALGGDDDVEVDVNEVPIQAGDYLLLCTDGLTRMVSEEAMAQTLAGEGDPQRACEALVAAANAAGGADNVTVVVAAVERVGWWTKLFSRR